MPVNKWYIENQEGIWQLSRNTPGFICHISEHLDDNYSIIQIATRQNWSGQFSTEYRGSLRTKMMPEKKVLLSIINSNGAEIFCILVEKFYEWRELAAPYYLVLSEKERFDTITRHC